MTKEQQDSTNSQPGEVRSSEGLGPAAWMRNDGMKCIPDDERDAWLSSGRADLVADYTQPLYAQATLDARVAAERERWRELLLTHMRQYDEQADRTADPIAARVLRGKAGALAEVADKA